MQVGTFLHEVKEGAVHAKDEVKGQLRRVRKRGEEKRGLGVWGWLGKSCKRD